jgi:hypothetical protein
LPPIGNISFRRIRCVPTKTAVPPHWAIVPTILGKMTILAEDRKYL